MNVTLTDIRDKLKKHAQEAWEELTGEERAAIARTGKRYADLVQRRLTGRIDEEKFDREMQQVEFQMAAWKVRLNGLIYRAFWTSMEELSRELLNVLAGIALKAAKLALAL